MAKDKSMKVRTRARTMSGYPGGRTMTLHPETAKLFIERGWVDLIEDPKAKPKESKPYSKGRSTTLDVTPAA